MVRRRPAIQHLAHIGRVARHPVGVAERDQRQRGLGGGVVAVPVGDAGTGGDPLGERDPGASGVMAGSRPSAFGLAHRRSGRQAIDRRRPGRTRSKCASGVARVAAQLARWRTCGCQPRSLGDVERLPVTHQLRLHRRVARIVGQREVTPHADRFDATFRQGRQARHRSAPASPPPWHPPGAVRCPRRDAAVPDGPPREPPRTLDAPSTARWPTARCRPPPGRQVVVRTGQPGHDRHVDAGRAQRQRLSGDSHARASSLPPRVRPGRTAASRGHSRRP